MTKAKNSLKILSASIENFKGIDAKVVKIGGRSLIVKGRNGASKSTFIQVLESAIDQKVLPSQPIKKGETRSTTQVVIGGMMDGVEQLYTIDKYYTPANNKGRIVVTDKDGNDVKSPISKINDLLNNSSFDIFKFLNDKKSKQIEVLKKLSGCGVQIDTLQMDYDKVFNERSALNAVISNEEAVIGNHGYSSEQVELYSERKDVESIEGELAGISTAYENWNKVNSGVVSRKANLPVMEEDIMSLQKQIDELKNAITAKEELIRTSKEQIAKGEEWLKTNTKPAVEEISTRIQSAREHNKHHDAINTYSEKQKALIAKKRKSEDLTAALKKNKRDQEDVIAKSKIPVKGLSFTADDIYYNDLPMEEGQIEKSKLIEIGFEIACALNPNLKTIFIHDGSLLDKKMLAYIVKRAEELDFQLVIEVVDYEGESDLEVLFTEEFIN